MVIENKMVDGGDELTIDEARELLKSSGVRRVVRRCGVAAGEMRATPHSHAPASAGAAPSLKR